MAVDEHIPDDDDVDDIDDIDDAEEQADPRTLPTEQEIDQVVERAVRAAAKGENVDHLLEVMGKLFPLQAKGEITRKFKKALKQKKLQEPSDDPDIPARSKLPRLHRMFEKIIQQQAAARVAALAAVKPEVLANAGQQGDKLTGSDVRSDRKHLTLVVDIDSARTPKNKKPKQDTGPER